MVADGFRIDQLSQLTGLSSRTLRYWEQLGLLTPSHVDTRGYRHYSNGNIEVILHLLLRRTMGLPTPRREHWQEEPAPLSLVQDVRSSVESHRRVSADLVRELRSHDTGSSVDVLLLVQLLVRFRRP